MARPRRGLRQRRRGNGHRAPRRSVRRRRPRRRARAGIPIYKPVDLSGNFDATVAEHTGTFVKDADRRDHRDAAGLRRSSGPSRTSTPTRTAGAASRRCWATRSSPGTSAPPSSRTDGRGEREGQLDPRAHPHGRYGNWLEHNVDWSLRASASGARRCRSGAALPDTTSPSRRSRSCPTSRSRT